MRKTTLSEILAREGILSEQPEKISLSAQLKKAAKTLGFKDIELYKPRSDDGYLGIYAIFDNTIKENDENAKYLRRNYIFCLEYCISMLTRCKVHIVTDWDIKREPLPPLDTIPFEERNPDKFQNIFKCPPEKKYLAQLDPNLNDDFQTEDDRGYLFSLSTSECRYEKLPKDKQPFEPDILKEFFYNPPSIKTKEKKARTNAKPLTPMKRSYKEEPSSEPSDKNIPDQKRQRITPKVK